MTQLVASATMEEAFDKWVQFLEPVIYVGKIALMMLLAVFAVYFMYLAFKEHAQEKAKERQYKYISESNTSTKSRLELVKLRKKDKVH